MPARRPADSFPYHPCVPAAEHNVKVPAWLNDVSLYHNRGDTTFIGENSQYGDFFGLDDLFTENPRVVDGMIDIYKTWIRDFRIDGFRMDTMKHVDDEFWQKFAPAIESYAKSQGIDDFYMFGEVAEDISRPITSHFTTHDDVQGVLDFPFQIVAPSTSPANSRADRRAARLLRRRRLVHGRRLERLQPADLPRATTTAGASACSCATRTRARPRPSCSQRDKLAHALMYFSRGNPVVYYGDEQGFTGAGGDQDARQDMFPSQDARSTTTSTTRASPATTARARTTTSAPTRRRWTTTSTRRIRSTASSRQLAARHAPPPGAAQRRPAAPLLVDAARASTRSRASTARARREYVVALNNSEQPASASVPTFVRATASWEKVYGDGPQRLRSGRDRRARRHASGRCRRSSTARRSASRAATRAPRVSVDVPADRPRPARGRAPTSRGDSFYEVTFLAKVGNGRWQDIGTDDNAPYRVFHDVSDVAPGTRVRYRAVVLDNAGHTRSSAVARSTVAPPAITLEAPNEGQRVRGTVEVRATATPEHANHVVTFERSVERRRRSRPSAPTTRRPSTPAFDDTSSLADGAQVTYRAVLTYAPGKTVTSDTRTVTIVQAQVTEAVDPLQPADGDYAVWGLHLFGDGLAPGEATAGVDEPDAVRGQRRVRRAAPDPASPTTRSASASSSTGDRRATRTSRTRDARPVLHPARHAGDLAAAG